MRDDFESSTWKQREAKLLIPFGVLAGSLKVAGLSKAVSCPTDSFDFLCESLYAQEYKGCLSNDQI